MRHQDYQTAREEFRAVLRVSGGYSGGPPSRVCYELGLCERALGNHENAVAAFEQAIAGNTFDEMVIWRARLNLALTLRDLGRRWEAWATIDECFLLLEDLDPEGWEYRWQLQSLAEHTERLRDCEGLAKPR